MDVIRYRSYSLGGSFETVASAYYIEDEWAVSDRWTVTLGLRNETFNNKNAEGESFVEIKDQLAPRLHVSYDLTTDGTRQLYGNWGRYHLPVAQQHQLAVIRG